MKNIINLILLFFISNSMIAQTAHELRLQADENFSNGQHEEAEINYKKALEKEEEYKANYNLGNTLYNQKRYEEATEAYQKALGETTNNFVKSKLYHNLGNTYFQSKKLKESMESLKESLRLNPTDEDTRKNLSLVKQIIKQQEKQQKKQQKQDQQQGDQNKDQDQDQNKNQAQKNKEKQQEQDKKENKNQKDKDKDKDKKDKKGQKKDEEKKEDEKNKQMAQNSDSTKLDSINISKEELQKLLNAIENDDKEIQKKVRKVNSKSSKKDKDW